MPSDPKGTRASKKEEAKPKEPKPPKMRRRDFLRVAGLGALAAALGTSAARAQEAEHVAQATTPPGTTARTETGNAASVADERCYSINPTTQQPTELSGEQVRTEYGYMFENRNATVVDLPAGGRVTLGDWEIEVEAIVTRFDRITVRNRQLNFEHKTESKRGSKAVLLTFPETDYARGPMLAISDEVNSMIYFFNKVTGHPSAHLFGYPVIFSGPAKVGTDIFQGEPYLVIAPSGAVTADGDMQLGTKFVQYALRTTMMSQYGDGPAVSVNYFIRR
jgi:hypothetical protein